MAGSRDKIAEQALFMIRSKLDNYLDYGDAKNLEDLSKTKLNTIKITGCISFDDKNYEIKATVNDKIEMASQEIKDKVWENGT